MQLKAIYNVIPAPRRKDQETLVYCLKDGFAWVFTLADGNSNTWSTKNPTAVGAEIEARQAGFDPLAVCYLRDT